MSTTGKRLYENAAKQIFTQHIDNVLFPLINSTFETLKALPQELGDELSIELKSFASLENPEHFWFDYPVLKFVVVFDEIRSDNKTPIQNSTQEHELASPQNLKAIKKADRSLVKLFEKFEQIKTISNDVTITITNKQAKIETTLYICGYAYKFNKILRK